MTTILLSFTVSFLLSLLFVKIYRLCVNQQQTRIFTIQETQKLTSHGYSNKEIKDMQCLYNKYWFNKVIVYDPQTNVYENIHSIEKCIILALINVYDDLQLSHQRSVDVESIFGHKYSALLTKLLLSCDKDIIFKRYTFNTLDLNYSLFDMCFKSENYRCKAYYSQPVSQYFLESLWDICTPNA